MICGWRRTSEMWGQMVSQQLMISSMRLKQNGKDFEDKQRNLAIQLFIHSNIDNIGWIFYYIVWFTIHDFTIILISVEPLTE